MASGLSPLLNSSGDAYYPQLQPTAGLCRAYEAVPVYQRTPEQTYVKQFYANQTNPLMSTPYLQSQSIVSHNDSYLMSQIPGPQNSCILDRELLNLPRDHYVDKLLRLTNSSEPDITSYRDVLYRRAKQLPTCPDAKLITRRGSRKTPAYDKLAHDCYILNSFLKGDPSEIETIFTKTKTQVVMNDNEIDLPEDKNSGIDLTMELSNVLSSVIDLGNKYAALQDEVKTDREKLHKISEELHLVKNENHALKQEMKNLTAKTYNSLIQHEERINTINDTNINMLKTYVSRIDSQIEAVQVQNCKAKDATNALSETQSLSYAEEVRNGTKIVESNFISKPKVVPEKETNQQNRHEQQDMSELNIQSKNSQNDSSKYEATPNGDCVNNTNIPMADTRTIQQNTMYFDREKSRWVRQQRSEQGKSQQTNIQDADEYYPEENTNKIETIITSKRQSTTNVNTNPHESSSFKFKGKYHGRTRSYFISNIDPDSSEHGLNQYLTDNTLTPVESYVFQCKSGDLAAKVVVPAHQGYLLEDYNFWPNFMKCRRWMSRRQWYQRRQSNNYRPENVRDHGNEQTHYGYDNRQAYQYYDDENNDHASIWNSNVPRRHER
ncbi:hypothetical protein MAR_026354 [Mya arenaria]|uniref:Uncharacterized protein n=1 Tax=Mya arenaria TaxID=6604 RepID=A0ABY7ETA6_MYAAR|nr:hypothetical protein MAR_026354 [Mya arenaria]